ncbi:MAG: signal peptidase I [Bacteroidales bacterium]|jgi:signal peptidase I
MKTLLIFSILFFISTAVGLYKLFEKAGYKGWYVLIPLYNYYIWLKIIKKPIWWYVFLIIPFINIFMLFLLIVELLKCFYKIKTSEQALGVLFPFIYLPYLGFDKTIKYTDPTKIKIRKSKSKEWFDAIVFAVVAAMIIRTFLIEAYTIPTSSMEKSLLVGDFLFVSKISYGPKIPNTPLAFPFAHHTLPLTKDTKSYIEWLKLPYYRFFGLGKIKNNDVVVFNYPDGDTVATKMQDRSYYALVRQYGHSTVWNDKETFGDIISRPVDKRENYIKRCIAIAGDTIKIINRQVFINGKKVENPREMQYQYSVVTDGSGINPNVFAKLNITDQVYVSNETYVLTLTAENAEKIRNFSNVRKVEPLNDTIWDKTVFPYSYHYKWTRDNFGSLWIPKAGVTIRIDTSNICLYERIIGVYEHNDLKIKGDKIFINGKESRIYTFKMNYYWMMGDNRHNSADSRYWGFVPEDHIVGSALLIWLSLDQNKSLPAKIRWSRLFNIIK